MQASDLQLKDLLQYQPDSGLIHLLDHRVLILDSMALGLLYRELIDSMGPHAARAVLSRFGYAHGWRTAESLRNQHPELFFGDKLTGPRLHTMQGLLTHLDLERTINERGELTTTAFWKDSYEVEQHLAHFGPADEPVCWSITAFASGYISNRIGREFFCIEMECCAQGAPMCRIEGRLREQWGEEYTDHLRYFGKDAIESLLPALNQQIKSLDEQLRRRKNRVKQAEDEELYTQLCASSASMRKTIDLARRVALVESTVVISGESGVGKEKIARLIHERSSRASRPFIAVNCGALAANLLESELFGHARGAFTDAVAERVGLFEAAHGGTLFLDEVGEIPPAMQVKLLRVLQEREVRRIGESQPRPVDIRILAATNRSLADEVAAGRFRQDLYYRLRVIELKIPPIRERSEDILPLARLYLDKYSRMTKRKALRLSPEAARRMVQYAWPGNVREIQNAIEYAVALTAGDQIGIEELPEELQAVQLPQTHHGLRSLAEVERDHILLALRTHGGNKSKTAKALDIGIATLYRKLKIEDSDEMAPPT